jgi:hypothetical protein
MAVEGHAEYLSNCNIEPDCFQPTDQQALFQQTRATHSPRVLLLYGSLRQRSFSRLSAEEAAKILQQALHLLIEVALPP